MKPIAILTALLIAQTAHAQVFKCQNAKGKLEYSDVPCSGAAVRSAEIRIHQTDLGSGASSMPQQNATMNQLDAAVAGALAERDYRRAKGLAVTTGQFEMIRQAELEERKIKAERDDKRRARLIEVSRNIQQQANHDQQMRALNQIENNTTKQNWPGQAPTYNCRQDYPSITPGEVTCRPR